MRKSIITLTVILFSCFGMLSAFAEGKYINEIEKMGIEELIELLNHDSWRERDKALVYGINKHLDDERVKDALLKRLKKETILVKQAQENGTLTEGYGEYHINLVDSATKLDDKRIVPLLIESLAVLAGRRIDEKLSEFGDYAAELLVKKLDDKDKFLKRNAIGTLTYMVKKGKLGPNATVKVKRGLIEAVEDKNFFVRKVAVRGLGAIGDDDAILLIKKIAKEDKHSFKTKRGEMKYPVREEALKVLKKLEAKEKKEKKSPPSPPGK